MKSQVFIKIISMSNSHVNSLILKEIVDFNDDDSNVSDRKIDSQISRLG